MTDIDSVVADVKKTFDLTARLKGQGRREGAVTVFLDEVAADALGGSDDILNQFGLVTGKTNWGVLGDIVEALAVDPDADVSDMRETAINLEKKLRASALTFRLRAVPELIVKDARRKGLASFGSKGKVPDESVMDFTSCMNAHLLAATIYQTVDAEGAEENGKLDYEGAALLEDFLPRSEYAKLYAKLQDVQFKQSISDTVTSDSDF